MEAKVWLKSELTGETCGSITAMFNTTIALLNARIAWLKENNLAASIIIELARDDMRKWQDELQLTEEDEV
ncbi:unnamed protein product [marine sediment metagenome]|uniref:Uncharacterized protein n=1 Tax=marine sediment metagenome TaxID=412755 RepID=X1JCD3_9ZZZZ